MREFAERLKSAIRKGLPGTDVQWELASAERHSPDFPKVAGPDAREAGVLILLFPVEGSVYTVLMQRPDYEGIHSGQISFLGGKKEFSDENIIRTALREAEEETGINSADVTVIGTLTPLFIPVSNMLVTSVTGWMDKRPEFKPNPKEVVFLIEADLNELMDPLIIRTMPFEVRGKMMEIKYFDYKGNVIWGATAMMLHELLSIIKRENISTITP
jgi:8-oxo-dGTP pyrophosphatase MutT (NUDIX family)